MEEKADLSQKERKVYEIGYILDPDLSGKNLLDTFELLKKIIKEKLKGNILETQKPKRINLAYPIQKKEKGYFGYFVFETTPQEIIELKDHLKYQKPILRYILIKRDRKELEKKETFYVEKRRKEKLDEGKLEKRLEEIIPKK